MTVDRLPTDWTFRLEILSLVNMPSTTLTGPDEDGAIFPSSSSSSCLDPIYCFRHEGLVS